jgi:hypothetical protein
MMQRKLACSFCGKPSNQVLSLIAGPRVFIAGPRVMICDQCVALCNETLDRHPPGAAEARSTVERPRGHSRWRQRLLAWWWSVAHPISNVSAYSSRENASDFRSLGSVQNVFYFH